MKVVLDTNLWVAAWLWRGIPQRLIELAQERQIISCTSLEILQELKKVLSYPKLQKQLSLIAYNQEDILMGTKEISIIYPIETVNIPELRDSDDTIILATAIAAQANVIISGDKDLLTLTTYQNISILNVKTFLNLYF